MFVRDNSGEVIVFGGSTNEGGGGRRSNVIPLKITSFFISSLEIWLGIGQLTSIVIPFSLHRLTVPRLFS